MEKQELIKAFEEWKDKDAQKRAYMLVIAERIDDDKQKSDCIINGNKGGIIVSLSEFIKQEPKLFLEAALWRAIASLRGDEETDKTQEETETKTKTKTSYHSIMVQKKSFLGIDITPRKELWRENAELHDRVKKQRVKLVELDEQLHKATDYIECLTGRVAELKKCVKELEKYDIRKRKRDKNGRYTKIDKQ